MKRIEKELWQRFLSKYEEEYSKFEYDVHVGAGTPAPPDSPAWLKKDVAALSRKRIDIVAHRPGVIEIIEIKERCGMSALGQLKTYLNLYMIYPGKLLHLKV